MGLFLGTEVKAGVRRAGQRSDIKDRKRNREFRTPRRLLQRNSFAKL